MSIDITARDQQVTARITLRANADMSSYIFRAMQVNSSGLVTYCTGNEWPVGILQNKPTAQYAAAELAIGGILKVEGGGTVTAGTQVEFDSTGRAVVKSGAGYCGGIALDTLTTAGEFCRIVFQPCYFAA